MFLLQHQLIKMILYPDYFALVSLELNILSKSHSFIILIYLKVTK